MLCRSGLKVLFTPPYFNARTNATDDNHDRQRDEQRDRRVTGRLMP